MDIFKLGDKILALLEAVFGFWNNQISLVFAMLGQSPVSFKGGGPWAVIEGIEPVFVAVGSSLVVLFFVIGFCSESIDVKDEMRFESIFRMLIRLGLAEWFVANNVTIMKAFFTSIGNLVGLISAGTTTQLAIDSTQADIIKELGFGESLVMLILTALLAIIIIICGFFIIYTVYFRFLKILIIVPLGAIACSTMAGNRMVSHTMATYCKYLLSCVFEAVTMALAIVVCNAFINAGLPSFTGSYADWAQTLIYLCEMTFTIDYFQKEQKHPITKAVLAPMKAVKKMLVSMELHLDASIDKLDNLAMNVKLDKEKHMESMKKQEQTEPERAEAERVEAEVVYSPMVAEPQEYQYNADAFEARGVDEVKQEAAHKETAKVREDKAR